jgi:hypothetical protein
VPAIKIVAGDPSFNITKYWTGQFEEFSSSAKTVKFYAAVSCLEKFKDGPQSLLNQFKDG